MVRRDEARASMNSGRERVWSIGMASSRATLHWQYEGVTTCTVGPEGKTATGRQTDAEILPIRRSGESKLDWYGCYCPRS